MKSAWARAMRQAAIETAAIVAGVVVTLTILAIGAAIGLYVLAGCTSAACI